MILGLVEAAQSVLNNLTAPALYETCKFEFIKDWIDGAIRHHVNEFHTGEGNCK